MQCIYISHDTLSLFHLEWRRAGSLYRIYLSGSKCHILRKIYLRQQQSDLGLYSISLIIPAYLKPQEAVNPSSASLGWAQEPEKNSEWTKASHRIEQNTFIEHLAWLTETTF